MSLFESEHDPANNATVIRIAHDKLITFASQSAVLEMVREEIQAALTHDQEFRILVREMVKEAIAKMNLQEVVAEAVKAHLKGNSEEVVDAQ